MANKRTFQARAVVTNGATSLGGITSVTVGARYRDLIVSQPDGTIGVVADVRGQEVTIEMESTDVTKAFAVLNGAEQATSFFAKESGLATYTKWTSGVTVLNRLSMQFARERDATMRLAGQIRFGDEASQFADVLEALPAQTAPTIVVPTRLYRPHEAMWTESGESAVQLLHVEAASLSLTAGLLTDQNDEDTGTAAVDRTEFGELSLSLTVKDMSVDGGVDRGIATLASQKGTLVLGLRGRGGAVDQTLTIRNLIWKDFNPEHGSGYSQGTLMGVAGWHDLTPAASPAVFTLTGANALAAFA